MDWEVRGTNKNGQPGIWRVSANTREEAKAKATARGIMVTTLLPAGGDSSAQAARHSAPSSGSAPRQVPQTPPRTVDNADWPPRDTAEQEVPQHAPQRAPQRVPQRDPQRAPRGAGDPDRPAQSGTPSDPATRRSKPPISDIEARMLLMSTTPSGPAEDRVPPQLAQLGARLKIVVPLLLTIAVIFGKVWLVNYIRERRDAPPTPTRVMPAQVPNADANGVPANGGAPDPAQVAAHRDPPPRPVAPPPPPSIADIDYQTLIQQPALWSEMKLSPTTRVRLSLFKDQAISFTLPASPFSHRPVPGSPGAGDVTHTQVEAIAIFYGRMVRDCLTYEEKQRFIDLFKAQSFPGVGIDGPPAGALNRFKLMAGNASGSALAAQQSEQTARKAMPCPWEDAEAWNNLDTASPLAQIPTLADALAVAQYQGRTADYDAVRRLGRDWFDRCKVDPSSRSAALAYLRPIVRSYIPDDRDINLFIKWADRSCIPDLSFLLSQRKDEAAVIVAMARLDPARAETEMRGRLNGGSPTAAAPLLTALKTDADPAVSALGTRLLDELNNNARPSPEESPALDASAHLPEDPSMPRPPTRDRFHQNAARSTLDVLDLLKSPDLRTRARAVGSVNPVGVTAEKQAGIRDALLSIAEDKQQSLMIRSDALDKLALFAQKDDLARLLKIAELPSQSAPSPVAAAVAMKIDPASAMPTIEARASDQSYVSQLGIHLLRYSGDGAEATGLALLKSSSSELHGTALRLLSLYGTGASVETVQARQAEETDPRLKPIYSSTLTTIRSRAPN